MNFEEVQIHADGILINGTLTIPKNATRIVIFAHGSGSSRFSPRNKFVAGKLNKAKIATLLIDLLTKEEEKFDETSKEYRFNIDLLASRLIYATHFIKQNLPTGYFNIGYFGASTGVAAALVAAAQLPNIISAIVSRGGRPDLAGEALGRVEAPVLLLVGGEDFKVIDLNKQALEKLTQTKNKELIIIPGATYLFEEPGKLEDVASYAIDWFKKYLS